MDRFASGIICGAVATCVLFVLILGTGGVVTIKEKTLIAKNLAYYDRETGAFVLEDYSKKE